MIVANQQVKSAEMSAVVLNADGSVKKDLGVVAFYHRNPLRMYWRKFTKGIKSWRP